MAKYNEIKDRENTLIGYERSTDNAQIPLDEKNKDFFDVLKWIDEGNVPGQDVDVLGKVKEKKIEEIKAEGVRRIGIQVPAWDSIEKVQFLVSVWNLLNTASITTAQGNARDIYLFVVDTAIPSINSMGTVGEVQAVDVANHPGWPF